MPERHTYVLVRVRPEPIGSGPELPTREVEFHAVTEIIKRIGPDRLSVSRETRISSGMLCVSRTLSNVEIGTAVAERLAVDRAAVAVFEVTHD